MMRLRSLWLGEDRGTLFVGQRYWLLWDRIEHLDIRVGLRRLGGEPGFAVGELWLSDPKRSMPSGRVSSTDLRELPMRGLEKALESPGYARAVVEASEDEEAPDFDPRVTDSAEALRIVGDRSGHEPIEPPPGALVLTEDTTPRRRPDSFYEQVMDAYGWALAQHDQPAQALADANDVPVTTVHRWMREAKRRRTEHMRALDQEFWWP